MTSRQQFITDLVGHYKKSHKDEFKAFKAIMKEKKMLLSDKDMAMMKDKKIRSAFKLPTTLWTMIDTMIGNPRFLSEDKEAKWFAKKFPEFLVPYEY